MSAKGKKRTDNSGRTARAGSPTTAGRNDRKVITEPTTDQRDAALASLTGSPSRASIRYRLALGLVAAFVVVMPLLYFGLLITAAVGIWWYLINAGSLLTWVTSGRAYLILRAVPIILGLIVLFFLVKPILTRQRHETSTMTLSPAEQPFLFEYVHKLSRLIGAPTPERIEVDLNVNASAFMAHRWRSIFTGSVALTIGLPLVSGLQLAEFTAVLAHELGHFSQRSGMRTAFVIHSVNRWFAQVIYQRDEWDAKLEAAADGDGYIALLAFLGKVGIGSSRLILKLLLRLSTTATSLMSRQMELDADQAAARVVGTQAITRSLELLPEVVTAFSWAQGVAQTTLSEGKLPDDLPLLTSLELHNMTPEQRAELAARIDAAGTNWYDSHPHTADRINNARRSGVSAQFDLVAPAPLLFDNYSALCRAATEMQYAALIPDVASLELIGSYEAHHSSVALRKEFEQVDEYFLRVPVGPGTLALAKPAPLAYNDIDTPIQTLATARTAAIDTSSAIETDLVSQLEHQRDVKAALLIFGRYGIEVADKETEMMSAPEVRNSLQATESEIELVHNSFAPYVKAQRTRIVETLNILATPGIGSRVSNAEEFFQRAERAVRVLSWLSPLAGARRDLSRTISVTEMVSLYVAIQAENDKINPSTIRVVNKEQVRALRSGLEALSERAKQQSWDGDRTRPFEAMLPTEPVDAGAQHALNNHLASAHAAIEAWQRAVHSATSELANVGLQLEEAVGLAPVDRDRPVKT